jgi:hypothetical protein
LLPAWDPSILRTPVPLPVPAGPAMGPAVFSGFDLVHSVLGTVPPRPPYLRRGPEGPAGRGPTPSWTAGPLLRPYYGLGRIAIRLTNCTVLGRCTAGGLLHRDGQVRVRPGEGFGDVSACSNPPIISCVCSVLRTYRTVRPYLRTSTTGLHMVADPTIRRIVAGKIEGDAV